MGIVGWIIDRLVTIIFSILGYILTWFSQGIGDIFNFDLKVFNTVFPSMLNLESIIKGVAIAICVLIYIWQLIRCISSGISGDVDDPILMSFKLIFVVFVIFYFKNLFFLMQKFFNLILSTVKKEWSDKLTNGSWLKDSVSSFVTSLDKADFKSKMGISILDSLTMNGVSMAVDLPIMIIKLILFIAIAWNYFKYLIEYVERYVLWAFLTLLAPFAVATAVSKQTNDIAKKFARMYVSSFLMILMGFIGLSMVNLAFIKCATATANLEGKVINGFLIWCLVIYASLIVLQRIDKHFAAAGMNTAQTGGAMLDLAATAMQTFRGISKTGTSYLTGLTGVKGGVAGLAGSRAAESGARSRMAPLLDKIAGGDLNKDTINKARGYSKGIKSNAAQARLNDEVDNAIKAGRDKKLNSLNDLNKALINGEISHDDYMNKTNAAMNGLGDEDKLAAETERNAAINQKGKADMQALKDNIASTPSESITPEDLKKYKTDSDQVLSTMRSGVAKDALQHESSAFMSNVAAKSYASTVPQFTQPSSVQEPKVIEQNIAGIKAHESSYSAYATTPEDRETIRTNTSKVISDYTDSQEKMWRQEYIANRITSEKYDSVMKELSKIKKDNQ